MFITIEGIDGCGKSLQARRLVETLTRRGKAVLWTREPGHWSGGEALRTVLLGGRLDHVMTELLLFMADRCEHLKQIVEPALAQGKWVICERYHDSTIAYQCGGRGIDRKAVDDLASLCAIRRPHLTFWLDLSVEEAQSRRAARGVGDRIEDEALDFHRRVARGFAELAESEKERIVRIDGSMGPDDVAAAIEDHLVRRGML